MPRTLINSIQTKALMAGTPGAGTLDITMTAIDNVNGNYTPLTGSEIMFAHNTGVGAVTLTITSAMDSMGRTGDITAYSLAAGDYVAIGPFPTQGWQQSDGSLYYTASAADIKVAVIKLGGSQVYR